MTSILEEIEGGEAYESRIEVRELFDNNFGANIPSADRTIGQAKSLTEFYELVSRALNDYEVRAGTPLKYHVNFTEEDPDEESETETVTFRLMKREPGSFSQGSPFEGDIKNLRPILREKINDPQNPDYQVAVTGYWYDNLVRFTCWARTNKQANTRACWFEDFMEDYTWWFRLQGVSRVLFWGRSEDETVTIDNNKWYGRPLNFFVRTEKIRVFEEKKLEQILVNLTTET
jgi:hypothetical protein